VVKFCVYKVEGTQEHCDMAFITKKINACTCIDIVTYFYIITPIEALVPAGSTCNQVMKTAISVIIIIIRFSSLFNLITVMAK
jgi:hypothetical protein